MGIERLCPAFNYVALNDRNEAKLMKWGLVPSWASDPSVGNRMINARAETLLEKPSFKRLVSERRCLIPADGFYEWRREGNGKVPVWIHLKNKEPFAFAGLWESWRDFDSGIVRETFTIITTDPNSLLRPIYNRMPVIYDRAMGRQWLEHQFGGSGMALAAALWPWPSEYMEAWDVSTLVNAPENDTPECIRPVGANQSSSRQLPLLTAAACHGLGSRRGNRIDGEISSILGLTRRVSRASLASVGIQPVVRQRRYHFK
jgi:putative SOS response-associated peptidase YedK